jgi:cell division protein FtsL
MTPPPPSAGGAATAGRLGRPQVAPRIPRRTSGPARARGGAAVAAPPRAPRPRRTPPVVQTLRRLPDARVLDRLLRGRAWIALVAVALLGIVFMQVSLLKLNAGISRAVSQSDTLERENAQLRTAVSGLDAEARIQETAALTGMQMPAAGDVRYLDARQADAARAARSITQPDRARAQAIQQAQVATGPSTTAATTTAATTQTATATPPATSTTTAPTAATSSGTTAGGTSGAATASAQAPSTAPSSAAAPTATTATTATASSTSGGALAPQGSR